MVDVDLGRPGLKLAFAQLLYEAAESCDIVEFQWFPQRYNGQWGHAIPPPSWVSGESIPGYP